MPEPPAKLSSQIEDYSMRTERALNDPDIPNIHFNGFVNNIGSGDILIILESNKKPVAVLNASYTVAKSLAQQLNMLINSLENLSDREIMTTDQINKFLSEGEKNDTE